MQYPKRLQQAAKDLNMPMQEITNALASRGHYVENKPTTRLSTEQLDIVDEILNGGKRASSSTLEVSSRDATTFQKLEYIRRKTGHPKTFFKYFGTQDHHFSSLEDGYIYLSPPSYFNDPFDCSLDLVDFSSRNNKDFTKRAVERFKQRVKDIGVCCFSRINDSILMWAHYANSHRGFCLEFSSDSENPHGIHPLDVCYSEMLAKLNFHNQADDAIANMIFTKSLDWKYEQEMRCIADGLVSQDDRKKRFDASTLKAVYLGVKCEEVTSEKIKDIVRGKYPLTKVYQASKSSDSFSIQFDTVSI